MYRIYPPISGKRILIVGGDLRQVHLGRLMEKQNYVYYIGLEMCEHTSKLCTTTSELEQMKIELDCIILPMPSSIDDKYINTPFSNEKLLINEVLKLRSENTHIYAGKITPSISKMINQLGIAHTDYMEIEQLAILNAIPTAEGAIQVAMEELSTTIFSSNCLIVGYGRISKILANSLVSLGANVTVTARKPHDIAWIKANRITAKYTNELKDIAKDANIIFNTAPAMVIDEHILKHIDKDCIIIDLASKPGGVDFSIAKKMGIKTVWALSLPSKVAPVSAAEIILDTISYLENERGNLYE